MPIAYLYKNKKILKTNKKATLDNPIVKVVEYYIPKTLLGTDNAKTIKGEKKGITTHIMYVAPASQNDFNVNLCTHASKGCKSACLFNSGTARFTNVQLAKTNKSNYFVADKKRYMMQLYNEIQKIVRLHDAVENGVTLGKKDNVIRYKDFAIRLNGSADISFETIKVVDNKNIFELFPNVQFYDYTKKENRMYTNASSNYHLTFSRSESNYKAVLRVLKSGGNVAVVFGINKSKELPKEYLGYEVVNGDETDLRFLDKTNVIVGVRYKNVVSVGNAIRNVTKFDSGFVVNVDELELTI